MALTKEQQRFAEENHGLIYAFLKKHSLCVDEWYDVAAIEYVKAVSAYSEDRGKFSTFAYKCMSFAISKEKRTWGAKRRSACVQSLDAPAFRDATTTLAEVVPDKIDTIHTNLAFAMFWARMDDRQKQMVQLRSIGHSQKNIADMTGLSQAHVSRILKSAKAILREEM